MSIKEKIMRFVKAQGNQVGSGAELGEILDEMVDSMPGPPGPQGPQGPQGNTGSSVDYPYELVNNLTTDNPEKGLSAAQGVVLKGEISQLGQEINGKVETTWYQGSITNTGKYVSGSARATCATPITKEARLIVNSTDIFCYVIVRYKDGKSPLSSESLTVDVDYYTELVTSTQGRNVLIVHDENFPNAYVSFRRMTSTAQTLISDVAAVVTITNLVNIETRLTGAEQGIIALQLADTLLSNRISDMSKIVEGEKLENLYLEQGGYTNGVPNSGTTRVRINRMIAKAEAPFRIIVPDNIDGILYGIAFYNTLDGYQSYDNFVSLYSTYPKGMLITQALIGDYAGFTLLFCASDRISVIAPSDLDGTVFITKNGVVQDIDDLGDDVSKLNNVTKNVGDSKYYGKIQTLKITDEEHKLTKREVVSHIYSTYPHTKNNQSLAIWDGKAFCFNDTGLNDGLCVVLDMETGSVIEWVEDIPSVLANSHINNASFTDQYYASDDKYPLILLSRGDYANGTASGQKLHVFRITESSGHFTFTHLKDIVFSNIPTTFFGATWEYDANRKMIWGHLSEHGDWRWGIGTNRTYNNKRLYFSAFEDTEYVCVSSVNNVAAVNATITITVGAITKTVNVTAGNGFEEVFPYVKNSGGYSSIIVNQSASAFSSNYVVYSCDEEGNNKIEIVYRCLIQGFQCPNLLDGEDTTVVQSDMSAPSYIDNCIFQGGACSNGKVFLPIQNYSTINGHGTDYTGHCCAVVEPGTGFIESIIVTDTMEDEGCAVWNNKLYISSHNGGATSKTTTPSFKLMEYSF